MLPARSRLRHSADFTDTVRGGARAGRPRLVVHLELAARAPRGPTGPPRAGFVVSKAVGGSVVRHAVVRRLRPLVAVRLAQLPDGTRLVVRALPAAAGASSRILAADLDAALERALRRAGAPTPAVCTSDRKA